MSGLVGVSLTFDDRPAVWREVPAVPRAGETLTYDGERYRVVEIAWYGTDTTWAATVRCLRDHGKVP